MGLPGVKFHPYKWSYFTPFITGILLLILLMEEILHNLGCKKLCE